MDAGAQVAQRGGAGALSGHLGAPATVAACRGRLLRRVGLAVVDAVLRVLVGAATTGAGGGSRPRDTRLVLESAGPAIRVGDGIHVAPAVEAVPNSPAAGARDRVASYSIGEGCVLVIGAGVALDG